MSGGHFDYQQYRIDDIAYQLARDIKKYENGYTDEYGDTWTYSSETIAKFKQTLLTLRQASEMVQRVDWLLSADDCEDSFHERWEAEVPKQFDEAWLGVDPDEED